MKRFAGLLILLSFCFVLTSPAQEIPRTLYVLNGSAETLSKWNMQSGAVQRDIVNVGQQPNQVAVHNGMIYVVNSGTDNIMAIDPRADGVIAKRIAVNAGSNPYWIAFTGEKKAYVSNFKADNVTILDLENGVVSGEIPVGKAPEGILVEGDLALVANTGYTGFGMPYENPSVSIIDIKSDAVLHTVPVPINPQHLALDPAGRVHVICTGDYATVFGQVAIIDLEGVTNPGTPEVVKIVEIGGSPGALAITPDGSGYCTDWGDCVNGFLYKYGAADGAVIRGAGDPILIGPNVSGLIYDGIENALWIPYMAEWGGDGFVHKFDPTEDRVVQVSPVLGNGTQAVAILEPISTAVDEKSADAAPRRFELLPNYPNPFNPATRITFTLDRAGRTELVVYNTLGQRIRTLLDRELEAGSFFADWNGLDQRGQPAGAGIYLCELRRGGERAIRRMTLVR